MRFLRMRPAVWAMISCSFSSLTRKVALGSNSVTTPGNSSTSSLAILTPGDGIWGVVGEGNDEVETVGDEFIKDMGRVDAHINADLFHHLVDELIGLAAIDAHRTGDDAAGKGLAGEGGG